jgi:hypothetical protein
VAGVSPADIKEVQPTLLPLQSGDKIFLRLRIFPQSLRLRFVVTSSAGRARHFLDFFAGRSLAQSPSRMSLSAPQAARPSPSYSVPGETKSTSGVKCAVLKIEIH